MPVSSVLERTIYYSRNAETVRHRAGVKMATTTLPVSENTVLVDMKLCTKPHGFMWTGMASKSRASALRVNDNVFRHR